MPINTQIITGRLSEADGDPITVGKVRFVLNRYDATENGIIAASNRVDVPIQSDGTIALTLWPNTLGINGTHYTVYLLNEQGSVVENYGAIQVGEDGPYTLADLVTAGVTPATNSYWQRLTQAEYDAAIAEIDAGVLAASNSAAQAGAFESGAEAARDLAAASALTAETEANNALSAVSWQDLSGLDATVTTTAFGGFIYDTSLDSDGGAAARRAGLPASVAILPETAEVLLVDMQDGSTFATLDFTGFTVTCATAINGQIFVGTTTGVVVLNYVTGELDVALKYSTSTTPALIGNNVNVLAATVQENAPLVAETDLPLVSIVVGTSSGLTIINGPAVVDGPPVEGRAVDITYTGGTGVISFAAFRKDGALIYAGDNSLQGKFLHVRYALPVSDLTEGSITAKGTSDEYYSYLAAADLQIHRAAGPNTITKALAGNAIAKSDQINFFRPNRTTPAQGSQVIMRNGSISPVITDATLTALLCSTSATVLTGTDTDRSPNDRNLTIIGSASRSPVASGADLVFYTLSDDSTVDLGTDISATGMVCWWQLVASVPTFYARDLSGGTSYVMGVAGSPPTGTITFSGTVMTITAGTPMALVTPSSRVLTEAEVVEKFKTESRWMQADAVVTLNSSTVRDAAYDKALNQYHVLTDAGHAVYDGRYYNRLSFVLGDWDWIAVDDGRVVKG